MPQQTPAQVIEMQRQDWNRVASGWEKWDQVFDDNMTCLNHRLVADARLRPGLRVLDLGSGTGYPSLLAAQVVGDATQPAAVVIPGDGRHPGRGHPDGHDALR